MEIKDENFKEEVLDSKLPVLVDFWASWCAPCSRVAPTVNEIAKEYQGRLKVCKLNIDESAQTASKYGIMSIPTLALFKDGKLVERTVGVVSKSTVEEKIKPYL
jgi:thioredoxin 1